MTTRHQAVRLRGTVAILHFELHVFSRLLHSVEIRIRYLSSEHTLRLVLKQDREIHHIVKRECIKCGVIARYIFFPFIFRRYYSTALR